MTIVLEVSSPSAAAVAIEEIKAIALGSPGQEPIEIHADGRVLSMGPQWEAYPTPDLLARLGEFGTVTVEP